MAALARGMSPIQVAGFLGRDESEVEEKGDKAPSAGYCPHYELELFGSPVPTEDRSFGTALPSDTPSQKVASHMNIGERDAQMCLLRTTSGTNRRMERERRTILLQ
jgi:hypothetical protein